jgi:microcystin-dependent protein
MANPYIGEIRLFGGNFAPSGWWFCDGTLLPISEYDTLFQLIGTIYGGDGQSTFGLPDLRGRVPLHQGQAILGETGGTESVTLTSNQIPAHAHAFTAAGVQGSDNSPANRVPAISQHVKLYTNDVPDTTLHSQSVGATGGSQPHTNFQPYLALSFIISLFGIFPQVS